MDAARFDPEALQKIWGRARCPLSGSFQVDFHHIEGRGGKYDRKLCSSPFNALPLHHDIHTYAPKSDPDLKRFFREFVTEKIMYAIARGEYELTKIDMEFQEKFPV